MLVQLLKLIRWQNLLIIVLTMVLIRYCIIKPILELIGYKLLLSTGLFIVLIAATVIIAAAGYVINSYFDQETDRINGKFNPVWSVLPAEAGIYIFIVLGLIGFLLGFWVSLKIGQPKFSMIFFLAITLLWIYSALLKHWFLIGNLTVAFLSAVVPLLLLIYDGLLLAKYYKDWQLIKVLSAWTLGYSVFAFGYTLIREIVKDIEDSQGDKAVGSKSLPVSLGLKATKLIVAIINLLLLSALIYVSVNYLRDIWSFVYLSVFLILPNLVFLLKLAKAQDRKQFHFLSQLLKFIMLSGIFYAVVACWIFKTL